MEKKNKTRTLSRSLLAFTLTPFMTGGLSLLAEEESDSPMSTFELDAVEVTPSADASAAGLSEAYVGGQVASGARVGVLGSMGNMETPYPITSFTQELIENQQAASVGEVLLNDPAVRVARGFGNFQQLYMIRGLPVYSDDMSYNGLYGLLPRQYLAAELVERVEVLRGASAFLNGAAPGGSGLGGAVNVMPKRAASNSDTVLTTGIQSGGQVYLAADWGERFLENDFGARLSVARRDGDTAVDGESTDLSLAAIGLDYRKDSLRLSADIGYQEFGKDASMPSITIASGLDIPDAPDASKSVAQPWTYSDEKDVFGTLRAEYDFSERVTAWVAGGFREGDEANSFANPTVFNESGDTSAYRFDNVRQEIVTTAEAGLRTRFETGALKHQASLSASVYDLESKNAYAFSSFAGFGDNLYFSEAVEAPAADFFVGGDMDDPLVTQRNRTSSIALADTIKTFEDRLIVIAGLRQQTIETFSYNYNTGLEESAYSDSALTPTVGALYKLTSNLSVYGNYIEGLSAGEVAPAVSGGVVVENAGEVMAPYVTEQIEFGLKYDWGVFGGAVSVFQSEKPMTGVDANGYFGVLDHQKNRGLELTGYGEPIRGLKLLGGISFLDTDVDGLEAIGSPDLQLNVGYDWSVPGFDGLSFDGRYLYTSSQYADAANTQTVPSWDRFDIGLRYEYPLTGDLDMTLRARIENLFDESYWASAGGYPGAGYLTVGAPRTFVLSTSFEF